MNTQEAINQVKAKLSDLEKNLSNEVRKVGCTLIFAGISPYTKAPSITAELFTPEWDRQREMHENYIRAVREGEISSDVNISLKPTGVFGNEISLTPELTAAIEEFEDYVFENYALPAQELNRKLHNLRKMRDAERNL